MGAKRNGKSRPEAACPLPSAPRSGADDRLIARVDVFWLAMNTGTNSDMIEHFYGQVELERMAEELRPEWRPGAGGAGTGEPPCPTRRGGRSARASCATEGPERDRAAQGVHRRDAVLPLGPRRPHILDRAI